MLLLDSCETLFAFFNLSVLGGQDLFFSLEPILRFRPGRAASLHVQLVGSEPDALLNRELHCLSFTNCYWHIAASFVHHSTTNCH